MKFFIFHLAPYGLPQRSPGIFVNTRSSRINRDVTYRVTTPEHGQSPLLCRLLFIDVCTKLERSVPS